MTRIVSSGAQDLVETMIRESIPLTRDNFIGLAFDEDFEPDAESLADVPDFDLLTDGFDPSEARDPQGKWTAGGSGSSPELAGIKPEEVKKLVAADREAMSIPQTDAINTPERQALRQTIEDTLYNKDAANRAHNRNATIILGLPGAGKSTFGNPLVSKGSLEIDADNAKAMLPEYRGGIGAFAVHSESSAITREVLKRAVTNGDDIVWPRIDSKDKIVADVKSLKDAGYKVNVKFIDVPMDVAIHSVITRYFETGRYVSPKVVMSYGTTPRESYEAAKASGLLNSAEAYARGRKTGFRKIK